MFYLIIAVSYGMLERPEPFGYLLCMYYRRHQRRGREPGAARTRKSVDFTILLFTVHSRPEKEEFLILEEVPLHEVQGRRQVG